MIILNLGHHTPCFCHQWDYDFPIRSNRNRSGMKRTPLPHFPPTGWCCWKPAPLGAAISKDSSTPLSSVTSLRLCALWIAAVRGIADWAQGCCHQPSEWAHSRRRLRLPGGTGSERETRAQPHSGGMARWEACGRWSVTWTEVSRALERLFHQPSNSGNKEMGHMKVTAAQESLVQPTYVHSYLC